VVNLLAISISIIYLEAYALVLWATINIFLLKLPYQTFFLVKAKICYGLPSLQVMLSKITSWNEQIINNWIVNSSISIAESILVPEALVFGSDDFVADIGATRTKSASELMYARQKMVTF